MNPPPKFDHPCPGTFAVGREGVTWGNSFFAFRCVPDAGFSRSDLAALVGLHPRSIKRIEKRSPALSAGRRSRNKRVLSYAIDAVLTFLDQAQIRIDLLAAISLGYPIGATRPDRFGFTTGGSRLSRGKRGGLAPFPAGLAQQTIAAWETWQEVRRKENALTSAVPIARNSALPSHTALALAAFTDATLSKARLTDWAHKSGHSPKHVEHQVAEISRRLRERLHSDEGQLLLALLLRPTEVPGQRETHGQSSFLRPLARAAS